MTELSSQKHKILIVDDKPENLSILFTLLNNYYEVFAAENGQIALEIIEENIPDLILLDIIMPVMDGYTFCEEIKKNKQTEKIPVIFMSALSETVDKVKGLELGAVDYIVKPLKQEEVLGRIRTQLRLVDYQKQLENMNQILDKKVSERTIQLKDKVDELEKANIKIVESERKYRALFENAPEAIILVDVNTGTIFDANPAAEKLFEYERNELLQVPQNKLFYTNTNNETKNRNKVISKPGEAASLDSFFNNIITKNGKKIPVQSSAKIMALDGNLVLQGILRDVSQQKIIEEQLLTAKENAVEMNQLKTNFLANMSHELRTPLIGILGFSQFLMEEISDEEKHRMLEIIHKGGKRLLDTLNLLLDISQIEKGEININEKVVIVNSVTHSRFMEYKNKIEEKNLSYSLDISNELQMAILNEQMLGTVIDNLIRNAIKFTDTGSIKVSVSKSNMLSQNWVKISVKDTGIGIHEEQIETIFSEFRQASEGSTRNFEGIGLGLTIVKKYIEFFRGRIDVISEPGKGSEFHVYIPKLNEKDIDVNGKVKFDIRHTDLHQRIVADKKTILYLEYDFASREFANLILANKYNLYNFDNAEDAVRSMLKINYDLIMIDVSLESAMAGLEVVELINNESQFADIPKVAVSAFTQKSEREDIMSKGFTHYLTKPFGKKELINLIESI